MNDLQECVFNIFSEFDRVCKTLNIKYYLMGGTMLGAIRHQKFIPWDDDIDVGIMRRDYNIFLSKAQELLPEYYFIQSINTDPEYPLGITKIRDSRTTFLEHQFRELNMNHGVYIDVFPLDYYPEQINGRWLLLWKRFLFKYRIRPIFKIKTNIVREIVFEKPLVKLLTLKYPTVKDAIRVRDKTYASIPESRWIANYYGMWGKKEIVPAEWYGEGASAKFEELAVTVPKEYDKWLTKVYGDYMQLPPPEKRVSHHHSDLIDLEKPYTFYMKKL